MQGLVKRRFGTRKEWQECDVVVEQTCMLVLAKSELIHSIPLGTIIATRRSKALNQHSFEIEVVAEGRTWRFSAESEELRKFWIDTIGISIAADELQQMKRAVLYRNWKVLAACYTEMVGERKFHNLIARTRCVDILETAGTVAPTSKTECVDPEPDPCTIAQLRCETLCRNAKVMQVLALQAQDEYEVFHEALGDAVNSQQICTMFTSDDEGTAKHDIETELEQADRSWQLVSSDPARPICTGYVFVQEALLQ